MTAEIAKVFLQYGLLGAITILALGYGWKKDRENKADSKAHQEEMTKFADRYISKAESWAQRYEELAREMKGLLDNFARRG